MRDSTLLAHLGRDSRRHYGIVNPPVYRASTVLFPTVEAYEGARTHHGVTYGRAGTPTTFALEEAIARLEGGHRTMVTASGKAACNLTLAALTEAGDHVLVVDCVYGPTRLFCERTLARFGVETSYFDPRIGADIIRLLRPNTRLVFLESPGSLTFELQDLRAIVARCRERGVLTVIDSTWATPLFLKPLELGVDVAIQAVTKYIGGHSDLVMGAVTSTREIHDRLRARLYEFGAPPSPEDCWLALRGLRTLAVRLERHQASALKLAEWLRGRPEVVRVYHPALPDHPDHELWRRDFRGASGLFSVLLRPYPHRAVCAMLEGLELFGIGASWGGYESLVLLARPERLRSAVPWREPGPLIRLHVGLEDPDDLIADLEEGFRRLAREAGA